MPSSCLDVAGIKSEDFGQNTVFLNLANLLYCLLSFSSFVKSPYMHVFVHVRVQLKIVTGIP